MKIKKLNVICGIALASSILLTGCGQSVSSKEKEVTEYNSLVKKTLDSFAEGKTYAESNQTNIIKYLVTGKDWNGVSSKEEGYDSSVVMSDSIDAISTIYSDYFTSTGASSVRQVLVLKGEGKILYATIIWTGDDVVSVSRRVVEG